MKPQKFIVVYDTYCGWCYGAAPIFDALVESGAEVEALHRHLFQGPLAYRMADGKGDLVIQADARISELTGQPFSQRYIDNVVLSETEILQSAYTAQAAALVHAKGAKTEFALRARLEKARYVDGVSAADRAAVIDALLAEGVPREEADRIDTPELAAKMEETTIRAREIMQAVGSRGVPTILKVRDGRYEIVDHAAFYGKPEQITALAA